MFSLAVQKRNLPKRQSCCTLTNHISVQNVFKELLWKNHKGISKQKPTARNNLPNLIFLTKKHQKNIKFDVFFIYYLKNYIFYLQAQYQFP